MRRRTSFSRKPVRFQIWKQIILVVLLISAISFLYDGYTRTRRAALENYSRQQEIHAFQIINAVKFRFELIRNVLDLWSTSPDIRYISEQTPETMERILAAHSSYISGVTRMDESGIIRYTIPVYEGTVGADISYQEHIKFLMENMTAVTSDAFMTVQGYWAIAFHVPCFGKEGEFRGSLAFLVPFREMFLRLFQQMLPGDETYPLVLDSHGHVLFSPNPAQEGLEYTEAFEGEEELTVLIDSALSGTRGYLLTDPCSIFSGDGEGRMVSTIVPFDLEGDQWILILSTPESFVLENIASLSNRWLLGMAAIVLLAMIYATLKLRVWITSREEKKWEDVAKLKDVLIRTVEQAREVVMILDSSEEIMYANKAAIEVTGYEGKYMGWKIQEVPFKEFEPAVSEIRKNVVHTGSWSGRITGLTLNEKPFKMDVTVSAVMGTGGNISNFIIIGRDVTIQVEMERRLVKQQKMEAIGQLAGGIAHDFNNLLVGVLGYAELLKERHPPDSDTVKAADVIISAVHQASELTRQLLGFARKGKHRVERVDLAESVRNVNTLLRRTMDRRIRVELDLQEGIHVRGDATQLEQVILNLAVNSRDAMPDGGVLQFKLSKQFVDPAVLGLPPDAEPMELALLETSDTGCGIPEEYLERIFEPFFTTKAEEGTGMGLATVYGIVMNHGGWVDVRSETGSGSTFTVFLPVDESSTLDQVPQRDEDNVARVSSRTILVVDDEYMVISTLMELLNELGYRVVTAPGGDKALELYSLEPDLYDAVILDLSMPGMDGRECFERLREIDQGVKVILATGFSRNGRVQELIDMGVMGFLQKPFRMKDLAEMLEEVIGG